MNKENKNRQGAARWLVRRRTGKLPYIVAAEYAAQELLRFVETEGQTNSVPKNDGLASISMSGQQFREICMPFIKACGVKYAEYDFFLTWLGEFCLRDRWKVEIFDRIVDGALMLEGALFTGKLYSPSSYQPENLMMLEAVQEVIRRHRRQKEEVGDLERVVFPMKELVDAFSVKHGLLPDARMFSEVQEGIALVENGGWDMQFFQPEDHDGDMILIFTRSVASVPELFTDCYRNGAAPVYVP